MRQAVSAADELMKHMNMDDNVMLSSSDGSELGGDSDGSGGRGDGGTKAAAAAAAAVSSLSSAHSTDADAAGAEAATAASSEGTSKLQRQLDLTVKAEKMPGLGRSSSRQQQQQQQQRSGKVNWEALSNIVAAKCRPGAIATLRTPASQQQHREQQREQQQRQQQQQDGASPSSSPRSPTSSTSAILTSEEQELASWKMGRTVRSSTGQIYAVFSPQEYDKNNRA